MGRKQKRRPDFGAIDGRDIDEYNAIVEKFETNFPSPGYTLDEVLKRQRELQAAQKSERTAHPLVTVSPEGTVVEDEKTPRGYKEKLERAQYKIKKMGQREAEMQEMVLVLGMALASVQDNLLANRGRSHPEGSYNWNLHNAEAAVKAAMQSLNKFRMENPWYDERRAAEDERAYRNIQQDP